MVFPQYSALSTQHWKSPHPSPPPEYREREKDRTSSRSARRERSGRITHGTTSGPNRLTGSDIGTSRLPLLPRCGNCEAPLWSQPPYDPRPFRHRQHGIVNPQIFVREPLRTGTPRRGRIRRARRRPVRRPRGRAHAIGKSPRTAQAGVRAGWRASSSLAGRLIFIRDIGKLWFVRLPRRDRRVTGGPRRKALQAQSPVRQASNTLSPLLTGSTRVASPPEANEQDLATPGKARPSGGQPN